MRTLLTALALTLLAGAHAQAAPRYTDQQLLAAEREADGDCRGSSDEAEIAVACPRRDRLVGMLTDRGWCYGKNGQIGANMAWHRCGTTSVVIDNVKPARRR